MPAVPAAQRERIRIDAWDAPPAIDATEYVTAANHILRGEVDLFGEWVSLSRFTDPWNVDPASGIRAPLIQGATLDYRDPALVGSARNVWEVNRHFQLVTLAQAWSLKGDIQFREAALGQLESWLRASPWPLGINWVSALEHGIRLINWYVMARMLRIGSEPADTSAAWLESIYRHCQFIWAHQSRYSSANNHLIGEMAGLYVGACAWPCWEQSALWRAEAKHILEREAHAQVHADGVIREQTVGYQLFVIQFLVICGLAGERAGDPFSGSYWNQIQRMIGFLRSIADVSGHLPDFGDSDQGMAYRLSQQAREHPLWDLFAVEGALFGDSGPRGPSAVRTSTSTNASSASWLQSGFPPPRNRPVGEAQTRRSFPEGGYFVLGTATGTPHEVNLVVDAGPLGYLSIAAHGHADCLSFTLSLAGEPFLVDPGTYTYHASPEWRDYFRGTSAHNTVRIDGVDQSVMCGPFMWMHKARAHVELLQLETPIQRIRASHDGYQRLADPVAHSRELIFDTNTSRLDVRDSIGCAAVHSVERYWHFAEHCAVEQVDPRTIEARGARATLQLRFEEGCSIQVVRGGMTPRAGWLSPRFGSLRETSTVIVTNTLQFSAGLVSSLSWQFKETP